MIERPLVINVAPTGAVSDSSKNPNVPITIDAIVADVDWAVQAGASIAHLHIRNDDGTPSCDPKKYGDLLARLRGRESCAGLILCASTSGRHGQSLEERAAVLKLPPASRPDMASLTLGDVQFPQGLSSNPPEAVRFLARTMREYNVKPELEIFDVGMLKVAAELAKEGLIQPPYYFNFILGNRVGLQPDVAELARAFARLPSESLISLGGIGRKQFYSNALGVLVADGVRVGLEDNLWAEFLPRKPATNLGLVSEIAHVARTLRRPIASRKRARDLLGLI